MNAKNIREFCENQPFLPFAVQLADGRAIPVEHPDFVFFPPSAQELIVYQKDGSFDFIDVFSITSLNIRKRNSKSGKSR